MDCSTIRKRICAGRSFGRVAERIATDSCALPRWDRVPLRTKETHVDLVKRQTSPNTAHGRSGKETARRQRRDRERSRKMEGGRGGGTCTSPSLSTSFSISTHRITQARLDPDAPGGRGGVAGAAVAVGVDAVLAGFARLPGYARRPHEVQRCTQPLFFELHVDPLQGECSEN
jgi:hypothetical protein